MHKLQSPKKVLRGKLSICHEGTLNYFFFFFSHEILKLAVPSERLYRVLLLLSGTTAGSIRGTKVGGSEIWRRVLPVYAQQEALTQLEFCDTRRCRDARWRHLPVHCAEVLGKERSRSAGEENTSTGCQFSAIQYYFQLPGSLHGSRLNLRQPVQLNCKFRTCGLVRQANPAFEGDPRGRRRRGEKEVKASHPSTPLALNARVQLCSDFFLRTSCGSRNNDSRSRPPLSPLKYGICIIQIQELLFFFSSLPSKVFLF